MIQESKAEAALALHRFGLGPRPGSIAAIASDPRGALIAELERPGVGRIDNPELMTSAQSSRAAFEARAGRQAERIVAERAKKEAEQQAKVMANNIAANDMAPNEMAPNEMARAEAAPSTDAAKPAAAPQAPPPPTPE